MEWVEGRHRDQEEMSVLEELMNEAQIAEVEIDRNFGLEPESDSESGSKTGSTEFASNTTRSQS